MYHKELVFVYPEIQAREKHWFEMTVFEMQLELLYSICGHTSHFGLEEFGIISFMFFFENVNKSSYSSLVCLSTSDLRILMTVFISVPSAWAVEEMVNILVSSLNLPILRIDAMQLSHWDEFIQLSRSIFLEPIS